MTRQRRMLLALGFAYVAAGSATTAVNGCDGTTLGSGGTGGTPSFTGFGGSTGTGGGAFATCDACLSGAPKTVCTDEVQGCRGDAACQALADCVANGYASGGGGTPATGSGGSGASSGAGASTASGGAGSGAGTASGSGAASGSGVGGGPMAHGQCDTSLEGGCCVLDCAAALGTPDDSLTLYLEQARCVSCANCKALCQVSDAYCQVIAPGGDALCR